MPPSTSQENYSEAQSEKKTVLQFNLYYLVLFCFKLISSPFM